MVEQASIFNNNQTTGGRASRPPFIMTKKNFVICEVMAKGDPTPIKGMTFHGYEAAMKTCVRLSMIHKDRKYIVYDKEKGVQYIIAEIDKQSDGLQG